VPAEAQRTLPTDVGHAVVLSAARLTAPSIRQASQGARVHAARRRLHAAIRAPQCRPLHGARCRSRHTTATACPSSARTCISASSARGCWCARSCARGRRCDVCLRRGPRTCAPAAQPWVPATACGVHFPCAAQPSRAPTGPYRVRRERGAARRGAGGGRTCSGASASGGPCGQRPYIPAARFPAGQRRRARARERAQVCGARSPCQPPRRPRIEQMTPHARIRSVALAAR
jgi:hypothetical protein